jgi:hypothetical protein
MRGLLAQKQARASDGPRFRPIGTGNLCSMKSA